MSYIGKNPKVDSVKLTGASTAASGTDEGQLYYNTGAGSISKGLKVFKNGQFVAIDKQLGDADTMQLLKASDVPAVDFNLSLTSTTVGGNNAVPFESSTGDFDGTASFSNDSTGNALLTDESADLVFHYETQATNSADNDFFGIPLTVPKAFRGGNLVLEFKYRTLIASGTMDDGYFNIAIQDRSSMILQTQASTITAGAIAAGANVLLTGKTYSNPVTGTTLTVAVGDRVFVESGTGTAGDQANDIVDAYITSVSSTDNNVTLSKDIVAVQSGKFVTGWLTGYDTEGQLPAAASDTDKVGSTKKIQFKTDDDTQQVSLWFFVKGTSTVKHDLFFDNILLSANKFLQASGRLKSEEYRVNGPMAFGTAATKMGYFSTINLEHSTLNELGTVTNSTSDGWSFQANQRCSVVVGAGQADSGTGYALGVVKNPTESQKDATIADNFNSNMTIEQIVSYHIDTSSGTNTTHGIQSGSAILEKGDKLYINGQTNFASGNNDVEPTLIMTVTADTNDVIILESQDETFTSWTSYTPTLNGVTSTAENLKFAWRRVGDSMEIAGSWFTATVAASELYFTLPSGYEIDQSVFYAGDRTQVGVGARQATNIFGYEKAQTCNLFIKAGGTNLDRIFFNYQSGGSFFSAVNGNTWMGASEAASIRVWSVPIKGWNANFNPLLSMPLQDFSSLENTFSARISSTGAITSQSGNCIASATKDTTGVYSVVFTSGFFGVAPSVVGIVEDNNRVFGITTGPATSGFTYKLNVSGTLTDANVDLIISRQGSDFRQAPQATAAVIKPAVAYVKDIKSQNTAGGTFASGDWRDRDLNTIQGESWFIESLSSNVVTLQAGTYKFSAVAPCFIVDLNQLRLFDSTNSNVLAVGVSGRVGTSGTDNDSSFTSKVECVATFTSSTGIKLQHRGSGTRATDGFGTASNFTNELYASMKIEKLK